MLFVGQEREGRARLCETALISGLRTSTLRIASLLATQPLGNPHPSAGH